ncbi:nucleotidyl transferase AbiEii/AbiGii toxin family protein [Tistrella mobilis]|uniref:nucleotidyl transferase AbiEii/AbiGii toxin family protein n=1 Tax=Tistrella mobilis TaxID=171437 RepID=UPI0035582D3B
MTGYRRPEHQAVAVLLDRLDAAVLEAGACRFGGGTAIVLALGEYRVSADVDFLCASTEGYRFLRQRIFDGGFGSLFRAPVTLPRGHRADQYGLRALIEIDGRPVKFEIVREARIDLDPPDARLCGCPVLSTADQYAEKLLANADRGADKAVAWRDAIDLGMLIRHLGPVPDAAVTKAVGAYGPSVLAALSRVHETLDLPENRRHARDRLGMTGEDLDRAVDALGADLRRLTGG